MDRKGAGRLIFLIVLLLLLIAAAYGYYLYYQQKLTNNQLQEKIEEITAKYKISETKLIEAQKIVSSLQDKIKEAEEQIKNLTEQLNQKEEERLQISSSLEELKKEIANLREARQNLEEKLSTSQKEISTLTKKIEDLTKEKEKLAKEAAQKSSSEVELGKVVVSPENTSSAVLKESAAPSSSKQKEQEGKVLVVNKEYDFAVINLGRKDGVKLNEVFSVYRGSDYLGDVKIEKLHDSMSAAAFVSTDLKDKIKEGDRVVKKI